LRLYGRGRLESNSVMTFIAASLRALSGLALTRGRLVA
jgi:hypothetical protein